MIYTLSLQSVLPFSDAAWRYSGVRIPLVLNGRRFLMAGFQAISSRDMWYVDVPVESFGLQQLA